MLQPPIKRLLTILLYCFWVFVTVIPVILLTILKLAFERFELISDLLILPILLFSVFGSMWLSLKTVHHMFDEDRKFLSAVKHTIFDLALTLRYLPLVGRFFASGEDNELSATEDRG